MRLGISENRMLHTKELVMDKLEKQLSETFDALLYEDYAKALSILTPLVERNVPDALSMLGIMHQLGRGVPKDILKAVTLLKKAYEKGDGVAAHNLGAIYAIGEEEIIKDLQKSSMYYRKAEQLGVKNIT